MKSWEKVKINLLGDKIFHKVDIKHQKIDKKTPDRINNLMQLLLEINL